MFLLFINYIQIHDESILCIVITITAIHVHKSTQETQ